MFKNISRRRNRRSREQMEVLLNNSVNHWKTRGFGMLCVADRTTDEMIGYCGFQTFDGTPEIEIVFGYLKSIGEKVSQPKRQELV